MTAALETLFVGVTAKAAAAASASATATKASSSSGAGAASSSSSSSSSSPAASVQPCSRADSVSNAARMAAAVPDAEHRVIDEYLRSVLGAPPEPRRPAFSFFAAQYSADANRVRSERVERARAEVERLQQQNLQPSSEAMKRAKAAFDAATATTTADALQELWSTRITDAQKADWAARAAVDARRADEQMRLYEERYVQLYRAVAHHRVGGGGGGAAGGGAVGKGEGDKGSRKRAADGDVHQGAGAGTGAGAGAGATPSSAGRSKKQATGAAADA
jgi:hypothetical protein